MKNKLPVTRYYGSKRKIINDIWDLLEKENLKFYSVLDIFGGTGTFAYKAKLEGKQVIYNDIFKFNYLIGKALIQNNSTKLTNKDIKFLSTKHNNINYSYHIRDNYQGFYYLDHENELIDIIVQNILQLKSPYKQAMAYYALFQTSLIKRPFNSFHRKNLSLRTRDVKRNFGNKVTWEKDLVQTFKKFCNDINPYIHSNGKKHKSRNTSALSCKETADLIYIDPPYVAKEGSHVNYHARYHLLEALTNYHDFTQHISYEKVNNEVIINKSNEFETKQSITDDIRKLIEKYQDKIIVFSYRNNGIPSPDELKSIFKEYNKKYTEHILDNHFYALNKSNSELHELIYILK